MADYFYYDNEASASSKPVNLELIFPTRVASPVYTGRRISGEVGGTDGNGSLKIMLIDSKTRQQVITGQVASLKVKLVLMVGDFGDGNIWTHLEFKNNIVDKWESKKNLLLGNLSLDLIDGSAIVDEIKIKHDSKSLKNVKFRLGAMVDDDCPYVIKEAITNPFDVKDRRNESKYLGPLSPNDRVWQLVNIAKKGPIRKRLERKQVSTVRDFLNMYSSNPKILQEICGIKGKRWHMTINHAKTSLHENVCNVFRRVGPTSPQSNVVASFGFNGSIQFDDNCYKPQPCENDLFGDMMILDYSFSIQDVEVWDVCILEFEPCRAYQVDRMEGSSTTVHDDGEEKCELAKKRWIKLRATIWFWMGSSTKKVGSCACAP